ncbi:ABC transporter ATP-binding protein [Romeria aff. gracilis LEGE 07310]|uniref:ABC transporter ATP-binding protein n=1 Tax=Vasconcelosia minhoensis LEGE 07310 TaxID=915328 RepID=A0A8J7A8W4_9CYAN|nr:ABC transporter ATP-binding protein [Romeria gracilis]MBE9078205.1 ABC transporter ATP-binding protein [Romeria aff. gracilis LEGE 07310]
MTEAPAVETTQLIVETTQLTKQFDDQNAVAAVNLQISPGEIYGLIGPNGAGKTTLIRMLATIDEPTAGEIHIGGQRLIRDQANPSIKQQIGFLPDDFPLYDDLTVWDYLDYFARLYYLKEPTLTQRIQEVIELVSLEDKQRSPIRQLSRGMKQRLSLARTVIHRPTLLLLDEPVSGLDPIARIQYRQTIKALQRQGMTILISSHILSDLEDFCTAIGIMEQGRLVESSQLRALYGRDSQRRIITASLGEAAALQTAVQAFDGVQVCEVLPDQKIGFAFAGTDVELAEVLRSLIQSGHAITEFHQTQETLEDIFIKLGYQKTA